MKAIIGYIVAVDNALAFILKAGVVALGIFISFAMVGGIVFRTLLGVQVFGIEELILMGAIWLYMLGAALASRERSHLSADFFQAFSNNETLLDIMSLVATTLSLVIAVFFVVWSYSLFSWGFDQVQVTPVFRIPQYFSQASLLVASILLFCYALRDLVKDVSRVYTKAVGR
ncbi:TRAP transporter small permease [Modicisalibacter luteus]|uniref:TRAP transporter small permease protein n=1 Tax=Modicisalibacter luteus TaxID=453962 RepID=A0ABV7LYB5_9GAMM|nr:TRAP transporter small permease subunit [Halomonas lutea]GHB01419.1 hypothetical protein GCM10007159_24060 [Halomonas lutea]